MKPLNDMEWVSSRFECDCIPGGVVLGVDPEDVSAPYFCEHCGREMRYVGGRVLTKDSRPFATILREALT